MKQAKTIKKLKIVNFDWLEDSLMNQSPKREGKYLMKGRVKEAAKAKAKKNATRKRNIKQGGNRLVLFESNDCPRDWLILISKSLRQGCQGVSR